MKQFLCSALAWAVVSPTIASACPVVMDGSAYVELPDWVKKYNHCITDKKQFERDLLAAVRRVPAADIEKNRDGYLGLSYLSPGNDEYKAKVAKYAAAVENAGIERHPKISKHALSSLAEYRAHYPKFASLFGDRLPEVVATMGAGGQQIAESEKCDFLELADISGTRSTREQASYFYDCKNGQRFYLTESAVKAGTNVKSQDELAVSKASAIPACRNLVLQHANAPQSVKFRPLTGTATYQANTTGNVVVMLDFDAKNRLGQTGKYRARCVFPPQQKPSIEISVAK